MSYEKTSAEQAYSELLFMPPPQTSADFRRAIMLAVLIGRQLEADFAGSPWQATPPVEPGSWEVACAETDFEPHRVMVFEQAGELYVECRDVGTNTVDAYHRGLMETRWRKASPGAEGVAPK